MRKLMKWRKEQEVMDKLTCKYCERNLGDSCYFKSKDYRKNGKGYCGNFRKGANEKTEYGFQQEMYLEDNQISMFDAAQKLEV